MGLGFRVFGCFRVQGFWVVFGASICGGEDHTIRVGRSNKLSYPWVMQLQGTRTAVQAGLNMILTVAAG